MLKNTPLFELATVPIYLMRDFTVMPQPTRVS
jgi:hypothetical protein